MTTIVDYINELKEKNNKLGCDVETQYNNMKSKKSVDALHRLLESFQGQKVVMGAKLGKIRGSILEEFIRDRLVELLKNFSSNLKYAESESQKRIEVPIVNNKKYKFSADYVIRNTMNKPLVIIECKIGADPNWFLSTACKFYFVKQELSCTKCYLILAHKPSQTVWNLFNSLKDKWLDGMIVLDNEDALKNFKDTLLNVLERT